jgi:hypothetical protein
MGKGAPKKMLNAGTISKTTLSKLGLLRDKTADATEELSPRMKMEVGNIMAQGFSKEAAIHISIQNKRNNEKLILQQKQQAINAARYPVHNEVDVPFVS